MLSAKEAKQKADNYVPPAAITALEKISREIEIAAERGHYVTNYYLEDNIQELVVHALRDSNYEVTITESGAENSCVSISWRNAPL